MVRAPLNCVPRANNGAGTLNCVPRANNGAGTLNCVPRANNGVGITEPSVMPRLHAAVYPCINTGPGEALHVATQVRLGSVYGELGK